MPLAGALLARFGCRRVLIVSLAMVCLSLPVLATASTIPFLFSALFIFGAGIGAIDCAINVQAIIVERASGRPLMSGFHGLFSVGGIAGAASVTALLSAGATPLAATLAVVVLIVAAMVKAAPGLLATGAAAQGPFFA